MPISVVADPLVRMFAAGGVLFALHAAFAPSPRSQIVVSTERVAAERGRLEQRLERVPTPAEVAAAVDAWVREEVLVREALSLGLASGDPVVRRRLVQQMSLLTRREAREAPTPTEPERLFDLTHVYLGEDSSKQDAARQQLVSGKDAATVGLPFAHGSALIRRTEGQLAAAFGQAFAARVASAPPPWSLVESSLGWHLVRVDRTTAASVDSGPPVGAGTGPTRDEFVAQLLGHYDVVVESL